MRAVSVILPLVMGALLSLSACRNSCQQICPRMAAYAEDCGFTVPAGQVSECVAAQAGAASRDDRAVCRSEGDRGTIRDEFTCEDLEDYWATAAFLDDPAVVGGDTGFSASGDFE